MMTLFHHQRYVDVSNISRNSSSCRHSKCYYIAARSATAICYRTDHGYGILKHCIIKVEIKRCDATRCTACVTFYMIKYEG
ncbi:hypothetical protein T02_5218 [Trichinella nativa]|uniref:Uncharacterized protein n=1 Tax=Trichinella nativa TaxID=6335 RepID=A0A0V1KQ64_9BILA|nr:hypothetical protein T02_5218 [Trichinella nativa]